MGAPPPPAQCIVTLSPSHHDRKYLNWLSSIETLVWTNIPADLIHYILVSLNSDEGPGVQFIEKGGILLPDYSRFSRIMTIYCLLFDNIIMYCICVGWNDTGFRPAWVRLSCPSGLLWPLYSVNCCMSQENTPSDRCILEYSNDRQTIFLSLNPLMDIWKVWRLNHQGYMIFLRCNDYGAGPSQPKKEKNPARNDVCPCTESMHLWHVLKTSIHWLVHSRQ